MQQRDLRQRTTEYALRIIHLYQALPASGAGHVLRHQLLRSGTSVGSHVAESMRAKSRADFTSKIDGAMQELEETIYWMDLLIAAGLVRASKLRPLLDESSELMSIFVSMVKKTRRS